jgi:hypothetical protein
VDVRMFWHFLDIHSTLTQNFFFPFLWYALYRGSCRHVHVSIVNRHARSLQSLNPLHRNLLFGVWMDMLWLCFSSSY